MALGNVQLRQLHLHGVASHWRTGRRNWLNCARPKARQTLSTPPLPTALSFLSPQICPTFALRRKSLGSLPAFFMQTSQPQSENCKARWRKKSLPRKNFKAEKFFQPVFSVFRPFSSRKSAFPSRSSTAQRGNKAFLHSLSVKYKHVFVRTFHHLFRSAEMREKPQPHKSSNT